MNDELRIVVVDDMPDVADSLATFLQMNGHEVRTAYGGQDALRLVEAWQPHCVLLDLGMPEMSGGELARQLRERSARSDGPDRRHRQARGDRRRCRRGAALQPAPAQAAAGRGTHHAAAALGRARRGARDAGQRLPPHRLSGARHPACQRRRMTRKTPTPDVPPDVRKGQAAPPLSREAFRERSSRAFADPAFDAERDAIARAGRDRVAGLRDGRKAPLTAQGRPGLRRPGLRAVGRVARDARRASRGAAGAARSATPLARARDLRLVAQRWHLPRRDVEDVAPRADRAARRCGRRGIEVDLLDLSLLTSEYGARSTLQGLRLDRDAAVPLAVQLLSEPRAAARPTTGWTRSTSAGAPRTA